MSLDKPPPSRYRVEEKDGRLIVHDSRDGSTTGEQFSSAAPAAQTRSAPGALGSTPNAAPPSSPPVSNDPGKAQRGATVVAVGIVLLLFLIFTSLWPALILAVAIAPIRQKMLTRVLPAVKLYIDEGRVS